MNIFLYYLKDAVLQILFLMVALVLFIVGFSELVAPIDKNMSYIVIWAIVYGSIVEMIRDLIFSKSKSLSNKNREYNKYDK